jgi:hypothetical protein
MYRSVVTVAMIDSSIKPAMEEREVKYTSK